MPQIREFESPISTFRPSETGIEATAMAARHSGALTREAGAEIAQVGAHLGRALQNAGDAYVQYAEHQEISHGAAAFAQINDSLTQAWNDTAKSANPNDPDVAARFRTNVLEPTLQKYSEGFATEGGQKWAEARVDALRNHFFEKTSADMSTLAAAAVSVNLKQSENSLSNTAINDPSSVPHLLDSSDALVGGMISSSPNIKGAAATKARMELTERMKETIVKSGAAGAIMNSSDPEATAREWSLRYPKYINGPEELALARSAKAQARANAANKKATLLYQKQLDTMAVHTAGNKIFSDNVTTDQTGNLQIKPDFFKEVTKIPMRYPNAPNSSEVARTLFDWGEKQLQPHKTVTDGATASGLDDRMFSADNPTTAIDVLKAEAAGKLSRPDGEIRMQLIRERDQEPVKDPIFKDAIAAARGQIEMTVPGTGQKIGQDKFVGFMQSFYNDYLKQKRAGTLPPNALYLNDPNSLISKAIAPYRSPIANSISANGGIQTRPPQRPAIPAKLRGIAALEYSAARNQYRDQASGKIYDAEGNEIRH